MIRAIAVILALLFAGPALAQGCGANNPNCVVPTAPAGDNSNRAASTAFVKTNLANLSITINGTGCTVGGSCSVVSPQLTYATRANAVAATIPSTATMIVLLGYSASNDGGGGNYIKLGGSPGTVRNWHFQSADGAWWQLVASPVYPRQVGAKLDASTDDATALQAWLDYGSIFSVVSAGQTGTAAVPTEVLNLTSNSVIDGLNQLTIQRQSNVVASLLDCNIANTTPQSNIQIKNLTLSTTAGFSSTSSNTIGLTSQTYTVPSGLNLSVGAGNFVQITANTSNANRVNYEIAQITAYSGTTLTVTATTAVGSGTFAAWFIDVYPVNGDLAVSNIAMRFTNCNQILADGNTVTGRFYNAYDSRNGTDIFFTRNNATGYVNRGIHMGAYLVGNAITNNKATFNHLNGNSFAQYGINTSASDSATGAGTLIQGNYIQGTNFQGVIVAGGETFSQVVDNTITMSLTTTGVGIIVEGLSGTGGLQVPQQVAVGDNTIYGGVQGIFIQNEYYCTVHNNIISGSGIGIYVLGGASGATTAYNTISGNVVQASGSNGIQLSGAVSGGVTGNSVIGNMLIGSTGTGLIADSNTSYGNYSGNVSQANGTAYSFAGTGNVTTGGNL